MRAGEKVCIHVIRATHFSELFASRHRWWIDSLPVMTGLGTIFTGISEEAASTLAIVSACCCTVLSTSGPYRCWLPVTNHASRSPKWAILFSWAGYRSLRLSATERISRSNRMSKRLPRLYPKNSRMRWNSLVRRPGSARMLLRSQIFSIFSDGHQRDCAESEGFDRDRVAGHQPDSNGRPAAFQTCLESR